MNAYILRQQLLHVGSRITRTELSRIMRNAVSNAVQPYGTIFPRRRKVLMRDVNDPLLLFFRIT